MLIPKKIKTECFLLPSAHRLEKDGTVTNSGRWLLWHNAAINPPGEARMFGDMFVPLMNKVIEMYKKDGGVLP